MKLKHLILLFLVLCSCEEVIEIDLEESEPRLVIDASIDWVKGTTGENQDIRISLTTPFFSEESSPVTNAQVTITKGDGSIFEFLQDDTPGLYETSNFIAELNASYTLKIIYNNDSYESNSVLTPVVPIDFVEQTQNGGLEGQDFEVKPNYTDPINEENFYLYSFESDFSVFPVLEVYDDEFTDGNQVFGYYSEEEIEIGDQVLIRAIGISERFYDYMFILLSQTNDEAGGPFETQPATLRGNILNVGNSNNFPLGFFRLSEVDEILYTIQ